MSNFDKFSTLYRKYLKEASETDPAYALIKGRTDDVAEKMLHALTRKSANKDGYAFKKTCKELGIKHTYTEIYKYLGV